MKPFMNADFLLPDSCSQRLYHDYAAQMPIIDYHCHLPPADVAGNSCFRDLAHAWLGGDHYKWRAMRSNGVAEEDITGHPADYRTFLAWARTVPKLIGNPLLPAIHGGVTAAFLEVTAIVELAWTALWEDMEQGRIAPDAAVPESLIVVGAGAIGLAGDAGLLRPVRHPQRQHVCPSRLGGHPACRTECDPAGSR